MTKAVPPDDLPRSRSGRVPRWVVDEAQGRPAEVVPFRAPQRGRAKPARPPRQRLRGAATAVAVVLVAGGLLWVSGQRGDSILGSAGAARSQAASRHAPRAGHEEHRHRLLPAPAAPIAPASSYRFLSRQDDGSPVTWSPCRPIHYVVRPDNAPPGGMALLKQSFASLQAATGLRFVDDGTTNEGPVEDREPYQPRKYGDRWAPVLVTWATPAEVPDFGIDVAGEAGPEWVFSPQGAKTYVSGTVALDAAWFSGALAHRESSLARLVVLHELGHLAGLAHVNDRSQVMWPRASGVAGYQVGDRAGLARLGDGPCRPDV